MGSSSSKKKEEHPFSKNNQRHYRVPSARLKNRFDAVDNVVYTTAYEASIDKVIIILFYINKIKFLINQTSPYLSFSFSLSHILTPTYPTFYHIY